MDFWASVDQWQKLLSLPALAALIALLRRIHFHPLGLVRRVWSFGIDVSEREMLLAMIDAEKASGERWKAIWERCRDDRAMCDEENAQLRVRLAVSDDSTDGGT